MRAQPKANNNMTSLRTYLLKSQLNTIPTMTQGPQRFCLLRGFTAASQAFERQSRLQTLLPFGPFPLVEPLGGILQLISPTHKRTEGRPPVWGSEFTSKRCRSTGGDTEETAVGCT
jgi:hypothetical protein